MLWDQRVVGSNPISPTINPDISDTSSKSYTEQTGNDRNESDIDGVNPPGIVTERTLRGQIAARKVAPESDQPLRPYKRKVPRKPIPLVYFIQSGDGPIKIGIALDPARRLAGLQTAHYSVLRILAVRKGGAKREREYHARFSEHHLRGEWFAPHPDILAEVARVRELLSWQD